MKAGLAKSALFVSLSIVSLTGCKTKPFCEPLGACGGDLFVGAADFVKNDGLVDRSWTIRAPASGQGSPAACQDELQLPPPPVSLLRQPPPVANQRPPDNVTADWCGTLVFKPTGEVAQFIPYGPPLPLRVGELTLSEDFDHNKTRGTYKMQTTVLQTRDLYLSETCLTGQGVRVSCPVLGRRLGDFLATEANIYSMRCQDPVDPNKGGCECKFELSFIGGPNGRWALQPNGTSITFFDATFAPPATADYCLNNDPNPDVGFLDLTGADETWLFNQKSLRTLHMTPPSCNDGVQSAELGETSVDCGPNCPDKVCTCSDGIANGDELGVDCGGSCLGVFCDGDDSTPRNMRHDSCNNGNKEPWEEGLDCGGPCKKECP
jgi:hypothetical protein